MNVVSGVILLTAIVGLLTQVVSLRTAIIESKKRSSRKGKRGKGAPRGRKRR